MPDKRKHKVVCFGEVLWDIFPFGEMPGGAPMNVTYHLKKFNVEANLITRVGNDVRGNRLMQMFSDKGISADHFQTDPDHSTGEVIVHQNERKELTYDIRRPAAWDFISPDAAHANLMADADCFVYGTLAARNRMSQDTLIGLLEMAQYKFMDVNLRSPNFSLELVEQLLQRADFVKMNLEELEVLTEPFSTYQRVEDRLANFQDRYKVSKIVVTMGADGAIMAIWDQVLRSPGISVSVQDAVGAGDAFLAGFLSKILDHVHYQKALDFACVAGAFVASQKGACPEYDIEQVDDLIQIQTQENLNFKSF